MVDLDAASLVKSSIPLSDYVSRLTSSPIKGSNGKYRTNCFLHNGDNSTALSIDDRLGLWKCYTGDCGGGSIIDMWMKVHDNTDFGEALQGLSQELNVQLPGRQKLGPNKRRIYQALNYVALECYNYLVDSRSNEAIEARRYLKSRGLKPKVAKNWVLGALPEGKDALDFVLEAADNDHEALVAGGVIGGEREDWVPLNGRLQFPIYDRQERVVAFGGRVLPDIDHSFQGKYVNTSETSIFSKRSILYGMDLITSQTKKVNIVEGYLDTIGSNEAFSDPEIVTLGTMGTSFTSTHAEVLNGIDDVTLAFDGDQAGKRAMTKSVWLTNHVPNNLKATTLNEQEDPWDIYVDDPEELTSAFQEAVPIIPLAVRSQWELVHNTRSDLDDWVKSISRMLTYTVHRDQLIEESAHVVGQNSAAYKRNLALPSNVRYISANVDDFDSVALSGNTQVLLSSLLNMDGETRDGIIASLRPWTKRVDGAARNWLPCHSDVDVDALKRVVLGSEEDTTPEIDRTLATLITDETKTDLGVILRGIGRQLLNAISSLSHEKSTQDSLSFQVRFIRKALEAARIPSMQPVVLTYLLDTSLDIERVSSTQFEKLATTAS